MMPARADVVVAGSGAAGLTAALAAAVAGASVLLVERGERLGGTTALSGGRRQRVPAPGDHHHEARAEVGGELDVGGELALADLADLRVGADQVDVGEARVDRHDLQAQPGQRPAELQALVGPERRAEQVRRRGGQFQRPEPLPGQRA